MKALPKTVLTVYVLILLWLVLFKFSYNLVSVLLHYQSRSVNLIPFVDCSPTNVREMVDNLIVFVPFGLLLSATAKRASFGQKLAAIAAFSLAVEVLQYVFAIGTTDVTDIIMNTLGGLLGLLLYEFGKLFFEPETLDRFVSLSIAGLLVLVILLRTLVFKVRY
jgi:glycopeptide antibiotics resistance protein